MTIVKNKDCIKYFTLAGITLLCIYSSVFSNLFIPIFDNIYYGNLVTLFVAVSNAIIWGIEIGLIVFACKKFNIAIFKSKEENKKELSTLKVILLFILTVAPMLIISACINWKVKIVYSLGMRITAIGLACNSCEILAYSVRMILMIMFIVCMQKGCEAIFKTKYIIPFGAIFAFLTFGLIDFFVFNVDLRLFYLLVSLLYGIIYITADRKFSTTWILCYLIYLL